MATVAQERRHEISSEDLHALAQSSPSGLAWVTNLKKGHDPLDPDPGSPSRWIHAAHVDFLDEILVNLVAGVYREQGYFGVIIMEPPRHGKSELCSHYFPAWYLGARPDNKVMLASYEAEFAASWGEKTRNTMEEYGPQYFGVTVNPKSQAKDNWSVAQHRGGMVTAGVGGALTGRGGNLLIVDDSVKNSKEAQSPAIQKTQREWWKSTFRTRAEPDAVALVIGTRWHENDLIGYLIEEMEDQDNDQFIIVRLPAVAEEPSEEYPDSDPLGRNVGDVLFPERWPVEKLRPHMANQYTWAALYQQRPAPAEGGMFEKDWFDVMPMPPGKWKKIVRYWDLAATDPKKGEDPDWTCGLKMGLHEDGYYYVIDIVHVQQSIGRLRNTIKDTLKEDGYRVRQRVEQEPGAAGKIAIWQLARDVFRGYAFKGRRTTGSKILRAETVSGHAERGEVRLVRGKWNRDFLKQLTTFPNAAHDDQVDAMSGAFEELTRRAGGMATF